MSSWGLKDNSMLTGNVTTANSSNTITGFGTLFLDEVDPGDFLTIASNEYQVDKVSSNTSLRLTAIAATTSANVRTFVRQAPKFLANIASTENVYSIKNVLGVDKDEALVQGNKNKGLKTQGWAHHLTWTGGHGQTRYRSEVLVAMSKNYNAANAGDAEDDATLLDYLLYFTLQPVNQANVAANSNVTIKVAANSQPIGSTITYQWYESPNNIVYAALTNTGVYSGVTTNTLAISNVANLNGKYYKSIISSANVATSNTSNIITITTV